MNKVSGLVKKDTRKIPPKTPATTPDAKYKKTMFIHKIDHLPNNCKVKNFY